MTHFEELLTSGAVTTERYGQLHVVRVDHDGQVNEFSAMGDFQAAMSLAERGIHWPPMPNLPEKA